MIQSAKKQRSRIIQFLNENGWSRQKSKDGALLRYVKNDATLKNPVNIYFTLQGIDDVEIQNENSEAEVIIRQFYGIPFTESVTSLGSHNRQKMTEKYDSSDRISTRIPDKYVNNEAIDVYLAAETITYLKSLVDSASRATASDEFSAGANLSGARKYARRCRFNHTFKSSFGFQVECPLERSDQLTFDIFDLELPFGRLVSERILRGLTSVIEAAQRDRPELITSQERGFNGKMCGQLADYIETTQLDSVDIGLELDPGIVSLIDQSVSVFHLYPHHGSLLRDAQRLLEPTDENESVNVIGRVVQLKARGRPLEDETAVRQITIAWEREGGQINVSANLTPDQYARAIRAHELGNHVQVKCTLVKDSGRNLLHDITLFAVLD